MPFNQLAASSEVQVAFYGFSGILLDHAGPLAAIGKNSQ
jgi:hypothetical protein